MTLGDTMKLKNIFRMLVTLVFLAMLTLTSQSRSAGRNFAEVLSWSISDLAWMSGDWQTDANGRAVSEEHWTRPRGGSMIGMSRTLVRDKMVSFEFLRLEQRPDGIYYVASPNGRCPATDFKLTGLSGEEAVFENPEHDFPKRIIYRRSSNGDLAAETDGGPGTKSDKFTFKAMPR
jgi:hypothetical protein